MKDYYYILGLEETATSAEIKTAYRKLSMKFHPDKNEGDDFFSRRFKDINEAYEILCDQHRRTSYDNSINLNKEKELKTNVYSNVAKTEPTSTKENQNTGNSDQLQSGFLGEYWGLITLLCYGVAAFDLFHFTFFTKSVDATIWLVATIFAIWQYQKQEKRKGHKK